MSAHAGTSPEKIAVIGIGCRFPGGANDHQTFWRNLVEGKDCITPTPPNRYDAAGLGSKDKAKPGRLVGGRGGYIDGFDEFDPAFFGISPREAHAMDPQQRKLLEVAWEALEDGGQRPGELAGQDVGVFVGAFTLDYKILQFSDLGFGTLEAHTATGTMMTMVSNRLSHCFDFRGPSLSVDSACSSSLVAVHLAAESLRRRESSLALAGGTLLHLAPQYTIAETKGGFLSPEGRSRTFDAAANGYVRAEGVGIVALKLLVDALRDGDPIHAVITETGVNQDGRTNGITVPSAEAQSALVEQVCARAGITPGSLQYVEAHGTSTPVGDPIEANALARALAVGRQPGAACYVGSVKTNIGHTESAAGIAGLIKTALSLEHRLIPPHINLERLNPAIDLAAAPYEIPDRVTPWPAHDGPARAGVNSFGFGGTNAHVLLEEAPSGVGVEESPGAVPERRSRADGLPFRVLPLSAHDAAVLPRLAEAVRAELEETAAQGPYATSPAPGAPPALADLAHSLACRRQHHDARLSVVYETRDDLDRALAAYARGEEHPRVLRGRRRDGQQASPVWVFTGMGPQWWAMGRELYGTSPVYREAVEAVDREIAAQAGWSLTAELNAAEDESRMAQTWLAQPANFAVQVGLAALWRAQGVRPAAIVGHSTGEVAAFYEAGVYSLRDAVRVVLHRSRLQHRLAGTGTMLAVGLPEDEAEALRHTTPLGDRLSVAAVNSPGALTLAGDREALAVYAEKLRTDGVFVKFLDVQVPYHSAAMDEIRAELLTELAGIEPRPARVPLHLTGRTGRAKGPELDAGYWWDNVRDTVRFRDAVDALLDDGHRTFLEIGPHPVLGHAIKECFAAREDAGPGPQQGVTVMPSIRRAEGEALRFATSLAALYTVGCALDWNALHPRGRWVPPPRYPWKRDRYWTEPASVAQVRLGQVDHPLLGRRLATAEPAWEVALDVETTPYLADHRIQGRALFPAAGYVEMAYQALHAQTGGTEAELGDIELRKALFLPEDAPRAVQLSLSAQTSAFTVATGGDTPAVHACGVVRGGVPASRTAPLDGTAIRARADRRLDSAACYETLGALGYDYGPAFQGIAEVWRTRGEALALIRPPACLGGAGGHHVHPVLLDACFQTLLVAGLPDEDVNGDGDEGAGGGEPERGMLLPLGIDAVRTAPVGDRPLWAHATVTRRGEDELVGDIALYTEDGVPLGYVRGFRAADVEQASAAVGVSTIDGWLAELIWTEAPLDAGQRRQGGEAEDDAGTGAVWDTESGTGTGTESGTGTGAGLAPVPNRRPVAPGTWLLFADRPGGVADHLARLAVTSGARCHLVRPGEAYAFDPDGRDSRVVPGSAGDLRRLLADLAAEAADEGRPAALDTVVHLWNLDLPALDDTARGHLDAHSTLGAYSVVALAQALQDAPEQSAAPAALHLVTRGAQAAVPGEPVEPLGASVWGIGRVLRHQELTTHRGKLIDLPLPSADPPRGSRPQHPQRPQEPARGDAEARAGAGARADTGAQADTGARAGVDARSRTTAEAQALLHEILAPPAPHHPHDEVALRGGRRLVSGLSRPEGLTRPFPPRLRPDGAYLVTGAFGALGRLLCRYLVRRGARHLVLVGRTALPDRATWRTLSPDSPAASAVRFVKELEALGAHPVHAALDVADEPALTRWLAAYRDRDAPPVRGVFHLAGHVRDTPVQALDRAAFDSAFDPKAAGAWLLHHHLRDEPLDHFVLFASVASLLTTAGQANYAAGNAFLDALAHHRRARGLPALSLDWGPWATGMIEELSLVEHYRAVRGMSSLSPSAGMAVLERVLGQDRAQLLVATVVDWKTFLAWYPSPPPLVRHLAAEAAEAAAPGGSAAGGGARDEQSDYLHRFRTAAGDGPRARLVTDRFLDCASSVLRMSAGQLDLDAGLGAYGIDSLLAMELRARIQAATGVALPVVALLSGAPLRDLTAQLLTATAGLASRATREPGAAAVEVHEDPSRHPLTQNQKALWFLKQLHPDGFAYNIGGAVEVRTAIDPELMTSAVRALVARHPMLRANFVREDGRPLQTVSDTVEPDIAVFDVEGMEWEGIRELIVQEYRRPYDLARDRLMRFRLFRRGPDRWVLMKAVHHIVSDAISTFTFIEELLALYEGMRSGHAVELPPVQGRYVDFLNRQNQFLASPDADRMLEYWRGALPAEVPPLALHTDAPRPPVQTHNGASEFFVLDDDLSARVHALAREHDVTVFVVLLCAYYLLLHRHSGQDDVVVGSPVTGRTDEDLSSVYGYFVNPLPLYAHLGGDPTVADLLAQVRGTVLGGIDHQEYPFVLLVEKLGLQHDPSRSAVFQAMFILLAHKVSSRQYGYHLDYIELPEEEGQFDLTLSAYEDEAEHRFHCVLKYNTDLFLPGTVRRLAGHYRNLLEALTRAPRDRAVAGLDMLGEDERHEILHGPAARGRELAPEPPVHELFVRAAARTPEAVAVTVPAAGPGGEARHLTYAELERASAVLAGRLRARGAGGGVVAVCLPKSPELIVALLAVLRAGAAYLPLDPGHPAERLAFMAGNAGARLVLTDPAGAERLDVPGAEFLTDVMAGAAFEDLATDDAPVGPDTTAYVIHTSGSTGRPKAVRVSHGALAALGAAWREEYGLGEAAGEPAPGSAHVPDPTPRVHLQMAGVSFDVFTGDLVRALCTGGRLVLADRELLLNTARLYEAMTAEGVDCAEFVPAVVRALMTHCEEGGHRLDFMRLLIVGSDTWKVAEYERLRALCGPYTRVINSYGLTEATVDSACFEGPTDGLDPNSTVPLGTPLPNCVLHVLDARRQPVPPGVTGELWAGGGGLAQGYAGDQEQTDLRFVTVTLDRGPDAVPERLYRTGDLARRDAQGRIHLLGRADAQIKLRGHRIEPGEIESLLTTLPEVTDAYAMVRTDDGGEPALCAYVVRAPGTSPDPRALRRHLAAHLPTYLIPARLHTLDALPLNANGKVDPDALPAPAADSPQEIHEPPVTLYEERVAAHWKAVIGLELVGLHSDFFASGGSSVSLIELIHRLQKEFGIAIPVGLLFKVTTLHGMARTVEDIVTGRVSGNLSHLSFNTGGGPLLFCFPPAGGHGLVYRHFAAHLRPYELIAFNHVDGDKGTRYADLVEALHPEGPCLLLGYSLGGNLAFEVAKELERRGREVAHVVIMDSYRIDEEYGVSAEHTEAFERELRDHLRRHTHAETVTAQTLEQARDYLEYCGRTPNHGSVAATVTVISDEAKVPFYAAGQRGSWHATSTTVSRLVRGAGLHAEMLDEKPAERNAALVLSALGDTLATVPRGRSASPAAVTTDRERHGA
ncbi:hybrid non-ribosomal peptide synthetase/type I polyketide synthase [Streptomyces liangshanensis]|uniref:Amino acid adenylation domain-containing protein n=1 Tax=Streptomyces liangshanensis TaxID=2717324 RepID=A0A6G9H0Z2_9ACTN|nr:hybrid non-ribosomal peptide synthetase/type I polyketide synthase [Streptomyces liangshanensis]QIQ03959.1 amino acid adenylation domain-containing protein [Streptomyces liangshanensis]